MSKNIIDCAIAGLGRIGSSLELDRKREKPASHAGAIFHHPECRLVGGVDPDPEKRSPFRKLWNCDNLYPGLDQMLKDIKPDILHIAAPPEKHLELCKIALRHSIKMIICEKPLAESLESARALHELDNDSQSKILVNHERRYSRDFLWARKIIQNGELGDFKSAEALIAMGRGSTPAEMLWEDGTHLLDVLSFLFDDEVLVAKSCFGDIQKKSGTSVLVFNLMERPCIVTASTEMKSLVFEMNLYFELGRMIIGNGRLELWKAQESSYYDNFYSLVKQSVPLFEKSAYFSNMMQDAVSCFKDPGKKPLSGTLQALRALESISAALNLTSS